MFDEYKLSLVFCAVDETYSLRNAFNNLYKTNCVFEVLFVLSKKCTSDCLKTVRSLCEYPNCRYIYQSSQGLGNAIKDSFDEVKGTHMIIWPADDGMDTNVFSQMVEVSKKNPNKILTVSRWLVNDGFKNYSKIRKIINYISQKIFSVMFESELTDFTNPTQIAPIQIYRSIKWQYDGFDFIPEMTFKPLKLGYDFIEIPCANTGRREGSVHSSFFELAKYYYVIYNIYRMDKTDMENKQI